MAVVASGLVGRRQELAALKRALGEVQGGSARAVGLRGEPGIGKSRLLAELAGQARESRLLVLEGRRPSWSAICRLRCWRTRSSRS